MIRFPKMHIAASALNRIMNAMEEKGPLTTGMQKPARAAVVSEPPITPNPTALGASIDSAVASPLQQIAVPPQNEAAAATDMATAAASGFSPFDGALVNAAS